MKPGDICAVRVQMTGAWPGWYLARIVNMWAGKVVGEGKIHAVRIFGETFNRDTFYDVNTISDPANQAAAKRLALKSPFTPVRYDRREDLTRAILAEMK